MYVVETDAPCRLCQDRHGYVTSMCNLCVYVDPGTAHWVASHIEGAKVRPIQSVPEGIDYNLYLHKGGKPDAAHPRTVTYLPRG